MSLGAACALLSLWALGASAAPDAGQYRRVPAKAGRDAGHPPVRGGEPIRGPGPSLAPMPPPRIESSLRGGPGALDGGAIGASAPAEVRLPTFKAHVFVSEELPPDPLRRLARPAVALWLDTRSNMLRDSTLDLLRASDESWVFVRPPVSDVQRRRLSTAPRSGIWMRSEDLGKQPRHWLGSRRLALEHAGGDPAAWRAIAAAKPSVVFWSEPGCDPAAWSAAGRSGALVIAVAPPADCPHAQPSALLRISHRAPGARPPVPGFVWLAPGTGVERLRELYVRDPSTQVWITVGEDPAKARWAAELLEAIDAEPAPRR